MTQDDAKLNAEELLENLTENSTENLQAELEISPLSESDYETWLPLWIKNNLGHHDEDVTKITWSRLTDIEFPVYGIVAKVEGNVIGMMHYVLHATTGCIEPACYMQDLFVDERFRKQGIARTMVLTLSALAREANWSRLYWLVSNDNDSAQKLYESLGMKMDFSLYLMPLR